MAEAGWFTDEHDPTLARWYDGERWTEHTLVIAEWTGPGAPPPPVEPEPTGWMPAYLLDPPPPPPPIEQRTLKRRYLGWPLWARIAVPAVAGLLLIGAITGGDDDDNDRNVEASDDADELPTIDAVAASAVEDLSVEVTQARMARLVRELCDASRSGAAAALVAITSDPDEQVEVLQAAGDAAQQTCPDTSAEHPALLNDVAAAATATTVDAGAGSAEIAAPASSITSAPRATTPTTKAPQATQPPQTQPPATQPPATSGACTPGYSQCLDPSVGDYDCAGGSGNGPGYVQGPIGVSGSDPYDLDGDGDGTGCDSG